MMTETVQIDCDYCPGRGTAADGFIRDRARVLHPVCADCALTVLSADWDGLEARVLAYQLDDTTRWQRIVRHRKARRTARRWRNAIQTLQSKEDS